MDKLYRIQAEITLNSKGGRTWPIKSGYRPGFDFKTRGLTSGSIKLLNRQELNPGETGLAEISFVSDELIGNAETGSKFKFYEGSTEIGYCKIVRILGWV